MSPVCGARDEQVRREGDYGEEEGGRSKFQEDYPLDLLIDKLMTNHTCMFR